MFKDQTDRLSVFNAHRVEYLVGAGHAVEEHSQPRNRNRVEPTVDRTTAAYFISRDDLIRNKLAVRRHRDLDDVERLQAAKRTAG